jgi:O-acetylserine/cysteine efflux transporter
MRDLVVWLSLVPPLPALLLSLAFDGPSGFARALGGLTWPGMALVFLGLAVIVLPWPRARSGTLGA